MSTPHGPPGANLGAIILVYLLAHGVIALVRWIQRRWER